MKELVREQREPWKSAFDRLVKSTDTTFVVHPYAHVMRGPYAKPNIGGDALSRSAGEAYNCALLWYITGDRHYAQTAIRILNAWSGTLWDFDYNDAKLLAGWTGHTLCNAAEILRYTGAGWSQGDIGRFTDMLMTVYYPLLRYYFPTANGNWDGAICHSLLSIAIFTDNRALFNNAIDHLLHAPVNGSIFKYIYPNGECEESGRDQGHVQLGLAEFAGAAQVAFTQGVDLFSIGNDRIGRGYEYTTGYILGHTPYCYCDLSPRTMHLGGGFEYVYRHYLAHGVRLPFVSKAADSMRSKIPRRTLTAVRASFAHTSHSTRQLKGDSTAYIAGADRGLPPIPANAVWVKPDQSIQQALDAVAGSGRWVVLAKGLHVLKTAL
ncbi:MAG: alginate lyase family protein, partial [Candidatus Saccharimonadales bacterium]